MRVAVELIIVGWVVVDQVVGKGGRATWTARQLTSSLVAFHKHLVAFHLKSAVLNLHHDCAQKSLKRKIREREGGGEGSRVGECDQPTVPTTSCSPPHKQESATSKSPNRNKTENKVFISPSASASCVNKISKKICLESVESGHWPAMPDCLQTK